MTDEKRRIHWLRLERPSTFSKLTMRDGHDISWEAARTGRIGFRFFTDKGMSVMEVYEEYSYKISSALPGLKVPQLHIEEAREEKLIGTLFPGLDPECGERERLIGEIAEIAADNHVTEEGAHRILWSFLLWAVNHDPNLMRDVKRRFPDWAKDAKEAIKRAKK
jgi:hypothetical protein